MPVCQVRKSSCTSGTLGDIDLANEAHYNCGLFNLIFFLVVLLVVQAYAELLEEGNINIPAWFTFNSKDGEHVVSGDSLLECASIAEASNKVVAVGINCTPPRFIQGLILSIRKVQSACFVISASLWGTSSNGSKFWFS